MRRRALPGRQANTRAWPRTGSGTHQVGERLMETIIGFLAGDLVGAREGKAGLERLKTSVRAIRSSPEVRKMASDAMVLAEQVVRRAPGGGTTRAGGGTRG